MLVDGVLQRRVEVLGGVEAVRIGANFLAGDLGQVAAAIGLRHPQAPPVVFVVERDVVRELGQAEQLVGDQGRAAGIVHLGVHHGHVGQKAGVLEQARQEGEGLLVVQLHAVDVAARGVDRHGEGPGRLGAAARGRAAGQGGGAGRDAEGVGVEGDVQGVGRDLGEDVLVEQGHRQHRPAHRIPLGRQVVAVGQERVEGRVAGLDRVGSARDGDRGAADQRGQVRAGHHPRRAEAQHRVVAHVPRQVHRGQALAIAVLGLDRRQHAGDELVAVGVLGGAHAAEADVAAQAPAQDIGLEVGLDVAAQIVFHHAGVVAEVAGGAQGEQGGVAVESQGLGRVVHRRREEAGRAAGGRVHAELRQVDGLPIGGERDLLQRRVGVGPVHRLAVHQAQRGGLEGIDLVADPGRELQAVRPLVVGVAGDGGEVVQVALRALAHLGQGPGSRRAGIAGPEVQDRDVAVGEVIGEALHVVLVPAQRGLDRVVEIGRVHAHQHVGGDLGRPVVDAGDGALVEGRVHFVEAVFHPGVDAVERAAGHHAVGDGVGQHRDVGDAGAGGRAGALAGAAEAGRFQVALLAGGVPVGVQEIERH